MEWLPPRKCTKSAVLSMLLVLTSWLMTCAAASHPENEWLNLINAMGDGQEAVRNDLSQMEGSDAGFEALGQHNREQDSHPPHHLTPESSLPHLHLSHSQPHRALVSSDRPTTLTGLTPTNVSVAPAKLGLLPPSRGSSDFANRLSRYATANLSAAADSVDWRSSYVLAAIQDQCSCASSWAFAVVAAVESLNAVSGNLAPINLSVQQIMDCQSGEGCSGGWPGSALTYAVGRGGLQRATDTPYLAIDAICNTFQQYFLGRPVTGFEELPEMKEEALMYALNFQPVIAFLQADSDTFQSYSGGIFESELCGSDPNHAVLIVGYGSEASQTSITPTPFWIIRNSWGPSWGEGGYMRILRSGGKGMCGITRLPPLYPTLGAKIGGRILQFSPIQPRFPPEGWQYNPCSPNPCGGGVCVRRPWRAANLAARFYTCTCRAPSLILALNSDGTQTCTFADACSVLETNPCAPGTCSNDGGGGYFCNCPAGFIQGALANGRPACVTGGFGSGGVVHVVKEGEFCRKIYRDYGLSEESFYDLNPGLDCNNLQIGQVLVLRLGEVACGRWYTWNASDTCEKVLNYFDLSAETFSSLNPLVSCSGLAEGALVCVAFPSSAPSRCAATGSIGNEASCQELAVALAILPNDLLSFNPWLRCDKLRKGIEVCTETTVLPDITCTSYVHVQQGDTCWAIYTRGGLTSEQFNGLNRGVVCNRLLIGQKICSASLV